MLAYLVLLAARFLLERRPSGLLAAATATAAPRQSAPAS